jgi:hypothetical protein
VTWLTGSLIGRLVLQQIGRSGREP